MNRRKFLTASLASLAVTARRGAFPEQGVSRPAAETPGDGALPAALREKLMHDPSRPQFHFLPKANWMNDPCAPRFFRGEYHMFFQYNPGAAIWGDMHWGHAKSPDLIHWTHLPMALSPTVGSYDEFGCFTGSVLPGMEIPTILYTGVTRTSPDRETIRGQGLREVQCLATSDDPNLLIWKKLDKPVLERPPEGLKVTGFRDPCPWKDGDTWYLAVGSGFPKVGGAVLLYRSTDGHNWVYVHPLTQGQWNSGTKTDPVDTGEMWECPDFFPLGGKHVLLYSTERKVYWQVGRFDPRELTFRRETSGLLDHGCYYAMKSMVDAKGRRLLWGWVQETRSPQECLQAGWAGAMALPRVLTLTGDNRLSMEIPPELRSMCRETGRVASSTRGELNPALAKLPIVHRAGRLEVEFQNSSGAFGLELRGANGKDSPPLISVTHNGSRDQRSVSIANLEIPLAPTSEGISSLDIWIDGSVIEVLVDRREALTVRSYQPAGDLYASWSGSENALRSLSISGVAPISADRLTS